MAYPRIAPEGLQKAAQSRKIWPITRRLFRLKLPHEPPRNQIKGGELVIDRRGSSRWAFNSLERILSQIEDLSWNAAKRLRWYLPRQRRQSGRRAAEQVLEPIKSCQRLRQMAGCPRQLQSGMDGLTCQHYGTNRAIRDNGAECWTYKPRLHRRLCQYLSASSRHRRLNLSLARRNQMVPLHWKNLT